VRRRGSRARRPPPRHAALVYSAAAIASRYRAIDEAFAGYPHACTTPQGELDARHSCGCCAGLGSHADANSGGEIDVALRAGLHARRRCVFTGVGQDRSAELGLRRSASASARSTSSRRARSPRIDTLARARGVRAKIAIRVNPDVDAGTHPHISTGLRINKFGHSRSPTWPALCERARAMEGVEIVGLHAHIGSQITTMTPLTNAARALVDLARALGGAARRIEHLDIGGGLGVSYNGTPVPGPREYAEAVLPVLRESGLAIVLEPGRHIMAPAGALLTRVVDVKRAGAADGGRRRRSALRRRRRGHDRADPADDVQRVPPDRAGRADGAAPSRSRRRRAAVREQRHAREGAQLPARSGRPLRRARCRRATDP
jgi:diaminopimelate decarboxylase